MCHTRHIENYVKWCKQYRIVFEDINFHLIVSVQIGDMIPHRVKW